MNLITCVIENGKPVDRKENWYRYYKPLLARFDAKFLLASSDNDGTCATLAYNGFDTNWITHGSLFAVGHLREDCLNILTFDKELPPRVDGNTYPRHWRSLLACFELARQLQCERLITLESDSWVLTGRLADRLIKQTSGIGCPWCAVHEMPELMLAVYHRDIFARVMEFITSKTWQEWAQPQPENLERVFGKEFKIKPWMDLIGDRYIEREAPEQTPPDNADFIIQGERIVPVWKG